MSNSKPAQIEVKRRKSYTEEQGDTICKLYDVNSMSFAEIGHLLGVSRARAHKAYHVHKKRLAEGFYEQDSVRIYREEMFKQAMSGMDMLKQAIDQLRSEGKTIVIAIGDYSHDPGGQITVMHDLSKSAADFSHSMHDVIHAISCFVRDKTAE